MCRELIVDSLPWSFIKISLISFLIDNYFQRGGWASWEGCRAAEGRQEQREAGGEVHPQGARGDGDAVWQAEAGKEAASIFIRTPPTEHFEIKTEVQTCVKVIKDMGIKRNWAQQHPFQNPERWYYHFWQIAEHFQQDCLECNDILPGKSIPIHCCTEMQWSLVFK